MKLFLLSFLVGIFGYIPISPSKINNRNLCINLNCISIANMDELFIYSGEGISLIKKNMKKRNNDDELELLELFNKLKDKLDYLSYADIQKVKLGLTISYYGHYGQKRKSRENFIIHPVCVALILSESKSDVDTIVGGLLHDIVEDTDIGLEEIELMFGVDVRRIVEGVTFVSSLSEEENLHLMLKSMRDDWRIIMVKVADRLHNMRTLSYLDYDKRIRIAKETLDIYSPLAHRVGMWNIKNELDDTSFRYLEPLKYRKISHEIKKHSKPYYYNIKNLKNEINEILYLQFPGKYNLEYRLKSIYSSWKKTEKYNCSLSELKDVVALRIIINEEWVTPLEDASSLCFRILSIIHGKWKYIPGTVKDYINFPKPNNYQSLHTTILVDSLIDSNLPIEIQIRTKKMHMVAEYGTAAHWIYKSDSRSVSWLNNLGDLQNPSSEKIKSYLKLPKLKLM